MSRALPPNYQAQRLPPTNLSPTTQQQSQQNHSYHHDHHQNPISMQNQRLPPVASSRHATRRLSSPLDFADSIPFNELILSSETLGSGSFGTVFKGRWRGLNVAVKQFKTREEIDSFSVEVKQLSRVKHPNIVKLYGASSPSRTAAYLIMEYAEGGSLNHLLHECRQQEYDLRHACSWAMQTARGVAYLHSFRPKPIMHRDLKPANLLLFSRGKILKICDFGTACAVKTQMTNNTGSASYMAPEVFSTSSYLESGDVFSWSIIFWEILVRQQPYYKQYSNPFQILWWVNKGTRPKEIEGCPEMIWKLITRSWDKNPMGRPSMKQVAQEMELIFSLARTNNISSNQSDTRSLPRSPEEVTTPTNDSNAPSNKCEQVQSRCKAFVSRFILNSSNQKPSTSAVVQTSSSASKLIMAPSLSSISPAHEALEHQAIINRQQDPSSSRSEEHVYQHHNHHYHKIHHYEQSHSQMSRHTNQSSSIHSQQRQTTATTRLKALMRHIALLQKRHDEIQNELSCDKKNSTAESFKEFSDLKNDIEQLRQLVKESGSGIQLTPGSSGSNNTYPTPPLTNHKPQRSQNQQIHEYENVLPQVVHDSS